MNWLIIPILLFIILVIFVLLNKPTQEVVQAVPYKPPETIIRKTVQLNPSPQVIDIPEAADTSMYDCNLDKSLDPTFEKTFFTPVKDTVDLDFPPTDIGCCPASKPMSQDLPIGNIPMCFAEQKKTYLRKNV